MGRYIFTEKDFEPFRTFLEHPLAQEALAAAIPVKQFNNTEIHIEESAVSVPGGVQSHDNPDGMPLHEVLAAVQEHAPEAQGLVVRNGNLVITHSKPPTREVRNKIDKMLGDPQFVSRLRRHPAAVQQPDADALVAKLKDANTSDEEWMKAFRQYAVRFLIKGER